MYTGISWDFWGGPYGFDYGVKLSLRSEGAMDGMNRLDGWMDKPIDSGIVCKDTCLNWNIKK